MPLEIRPIEPDEVLAYRRAVRFGFSTPDTTDDADWASAMFDPIDRCIAAFDRDRIVATLRSFATELTLPGGATVPAGALTAVTCHPTHRRQGVLTQMLGSDLAASRARGEPCGVLIAAEYPIYGRFGYGPATVATAWELDARAANFANRGAGTVEFADDETLRKEAPAIFDRVRRARPGMIDRSEFVWDYRCAIRRAPDDKPWSGFRLLCRDDDGMAQGWANYTFEDKWEGMRSFDKVDVVDLCAATPEAEARLWRFLAELDLVATIAAADRPLDDTLPWLLHDARVAKCSRTHDFVWVRPLDVAHLLSERAYTTAGQVVIDVVDPQGFANGRVRVDATADGATCMPTSNSADLTVPVRTLGAVVLGGHRVRMLHTAGWLDEHTPGAVAVADRLLAGDVAPWCNTWF